MIKKVLDNLLYLFPCFALLARTNQSLSDDAHKIKNTVFFFDIYGLLKLSIKTQSTKTEKASD